MIGRMIAKALPLRAIGAVAGNAPRAGAMARGLGERLRNVSNNRYSRRVARMKLALPAIGFCSRKPRTLAAQPHDSGGPRKLSVS